MDATTTVSVLEFDDSTPESAAASVTSALVALQQALVAKGVRSALTPMELVQLAAASSRLSMTLPSAMPLPAGAYSPELTLTFPLAPGLSPLDGSIDLMLPAIGPDGAMGDTRVHRGRWTKKTQTISTLRRFWYGIHQQYLRLAEA